MTKMEAITKVLEAGRKEFEKGKSFSINGVTFSNFSGKSSMEFEYNDKDETIYSLHVVNGENVVSVVFVEDITKVSVNSDNFILTSDILQEIYGNVNGEKINIKECE